MRLRAFAKINLGLDVLGKRPDGYHEIRTIMQSIDMYDVIEMEPAPEKGICLTTNLPYIPTDDRNLVYQAANLLLKEFEIDEGLRIDLKKKIPVAAGMAGGSSDAAATLVGVNNLFHLGLSMEELMKRGARLGADVPFCVMRGTALAEGIGEKLTRVSPAPECYILIGKPSSVSISTKAAYRILDEQGISDHPDIDGILESIRAGDLEGMARRMGNVFEPVQAGFHPVIGEIRDTMEECGAVKAMMSGSGPTVFGLFLSRNLAIKAGNVIRHRFNVRQPFVAEFYQPRSGNSKSEGEQDDQ